MAQGGNLLAGIEVAIASHSDCCTGMKVVAVMVLALAQVEQDELRQIDLILGEGKLGDKRLGDL